MKNGIYINENTFVSFAQLNRASMGNQYATRQKAMDLSAMFGYLPNPDTVLRKLGRSIEVYNDLIVDPHVGAVTESRKDSVLSMEWDINRDESKSKKAKFFKDLFDDLDMHRIITEILDAPLYGYQVMEVIWKKLGQYWVPVDVIGKPQHWFVFDDDNVLKMKTKSNQLGEDIPERKFLLATHNATYMNPYGFPVLSRCFWPVTFKKGGMKFWVVFTEKYGMPWPVGKHPRGIDSSEVDELADSLEVMVQDGIAVIPDDSSIEFLESGSKGASVDVYLKLGEFCNSEISKGVLGNTLTTEIQGTGSYAASQTHMQKEDKKADTDKKIVEKVINDLIGWTDDYNFASGDKPKYEMFQEEDVDQALAERDKMLSDTGQIKFTKKYFMNNYDFAEDEIEVIDADSNQPTAISPKAPTPDPSTTSTPLSEPLRDLPSQEGNEKDEFAQLIKSNPQQAIDNVLKSIKPDAMQSQVIEAINPVIDLIQSGSNYEEVMENLIDVFPEMNADDLEDTLTKLNFIAEVWGRISNDAIA